MRVGIFGGTFDPLHWGHFHLAISLLEKHNLDQVWWIPVQINPFKESQPVSAKDRLAMLKLGLEGISAFKVMDLEMNRPGPSYTIDTLRELHRAHPEVSFYLLLGDDALAHFDRWKDPEEIIDLAPPLIGARQYLNFPSFLSLPQKVLNALEEGWTPLPLMEISATNIRKRLKEKLFCAHLAPAKVLDYIAQHRLYSPL